MLTIRRVPTVVSINQVSEQNCGKNCLGSCCMPGSQLPLYSFLRRKTIRESFMDSAHQPAVDRSGILTPNEQISQLDALILSKWEDCFGRGLFRYDVTACETKVLEGEYGFVAQLNEGRHLKKRPTEFRVDQVLQPFDEKKFNFTKVGQEEVLFRFEESVDGKSEYNEKASIQSDSPNVVAINVSPIEYGHVLLVPRVMDCIPQRIDPDTLLLALHMAVEVKNPYFRLGYNSLGAFATINHLHFQAYYLNSPFAIERAPIKAVAHPRREGGSRLFELVNYPTRGLVYEVGSDLDEFAAVVAKSCMVLQDNNIPFNLLIADCGARVFLLPQCFAERQARGDVAQVVLDTQVNPAVWEISGHIVLKRKDDYEMATEDYAWKLLAEVSLSTERYEEVKQMCLEAAEAQWRSFPLSDEFEDTLVSAEEDAVRVGFRGLLKFKTKAKKSMDMESLLKEYIFPRA